MAWKTKTDKKFNYTLNAYLHVMLQNELTMAYTLQYMGTNDLPERDNFKENTLCSYIMNRMTTDSDGGGSARSEIDFSMLMIILTSNIKFKITLSELK